MCDINEEYRKKLKPHPRSKKVIEEMKKVMTKNDFFSVKYSEGSRNKDVLFILSCPGRIEFLRDKPCSGQTGKNLEEFIKILSEDFPAIFSDSDRYSYNIINSSEVVHFKMLGNDTEPNEKEIEKQIAVDKQNTSKMQLILNSKYIFCFGEKAKIYFENINTEFNKIYVECCHLGNQSLNTNNCLNSYIKNILGENCNQHNIKIKRRIKYLYELKKEKNEKMVKTVNSSSQEQKN